MTRQARNGWVRHGAVGIGVAGKARFCEVRFVEVGRGPVSSGMAGKAR